ncbi:MAG: acyl-CoA dehydrogenase family protein [Desulfomonilia bacterium]
MHPLNERQQALIEDARRFASENIQILDSGDDRTAAAARLYRAFARGGYHALLIPEDLGGKGLDYVSTGLVYEALSYHLPATLHGPITTAHCIEMIRIGCQGARRDEILSAIASKGMAVGFCLTEEGAGSDIASISTRAERSGRGFTITGNKSIVINHAIASLLIVFAARPGRRGRAGLNAFLVDAALPGVRIGKPYETPGFPGSIMGDVVFDHVPVSRDSLLGEDDSGYFLLMETLDKGRPLVAASCTGAARKAFDLVLDHAKNRIQFGKPLFSFQGISLPLAELATRLEASRLLTFDALSRIDGNRTFSMEASMAKLHAADTLLDIASFGIEVLGYRAAGTSAEAREIVRIHQDAQLMKSIDGTANVQKMVIASQL